MKKEKHHFPKKWMLLMIGCIAVIVIVAGVYTYRSQPEVSPTAAFITSHMVNQNGTLASRLLPANSTNPDIVAGREALSESLGLWMQYALLTDDSKSFEHSYTLLQQYFLDKDKHYIYWKLEPSGQSKVNTNALGDDLRIVGALLQASTQWKQPDYHATAKQIVDTLLTSDQQHGYLVDYHDFEHGYSADVLSLTYIDVPALEQMKQTNMITTQEYTKYTNLLHNTPNDGVFYPRTYSVATGTYNYDDTINLIDQLILAIHRSELGEPSDQLIAFMKKEFKQNRKLAGRYKRADQTADVAYESPAVYGLAILLALQENDQTWAEQLYAQMLTMRGWDQAYPGGYVFDGDTHIFDDLFPLLAETHLQKGSDTK